MEGDEMKKLSNNKVVAYILLIMLILTCNSGIVLAADATTYPNDTYLIEKISNPTTLQGDTDGLDPTEPNRSNSYTWTQAQLGNYIYLGSNRNVLAGTFLQATAGKLDPELTLHFLNDISDGDIPTDMSAITDGTARVFRYDISTGKIEEVYRETGLTGYRGALTFQGENAESPSVYLGALGDQAKVLRFDEGFQPGDDPVPVFESETGYTSVRAMAEHEGAMCIGVLTLAQGDYGGDLQVMLATDPAVSEGHWTEIADIEDFASCSPRTDQAAAGQCGIWDMISYNGFLYAFIGTGYVKDSESNGYCVYKGSYDPENPDANEADWVWQMIVGPDAKYPRGMGYEYDGSASPFLYTDPTDGKTYVYVGTFDAIFDSIFAILGDEDGNNMGYEAVYHAMHPAKVYRFDENDDWQMVIGNPDDVITEKIGNYYAGFSNSTSASVYSPNLYMWRMATYNGELYVGTFDGSTLLDQIVPPMDIDFDTYTDDDLVTILTALKDVLYLPEEAVNAMIAAIKYKDKTAADAEEALAVYEESEDVLAAGNEALTAAEASCTEAENYVDPKFLDACDLYSDLLDCEGKTLDFAELAAEAYANADLAVTTAALASSAAASASAGVDDWEAAVGTDYNNDFNNEVYSIRDDVSDAVDAAQEYNTLAKAEYDAAADLAATAAAIVDDARDDLIAIAADVNELFASITPEQYAMAAKLFDTLEEMGYTDDEFDQLQYILKLRVMINATEKADQMGCSVYKTSDGKNFTPITDNGFNDKYNYGLRTFLSTTNGLFMGMANPYYGAQLWRLTPKSTDDGDGDGGGGGGGGGGGATILEEEVPLGGLTLAALNLNDHYGYVQGYDDGTIKPEANMTRAEVATIFYRLLTDETRALYKTETSSFSDVASTDWFRTAVSTLVNAGVLTGYSDGTFRPYAPVTRAEFATILSKFTESGSGSSTFNDIASNWAKDNINIAYSNGWITGYSDNTFRPGKVVSRAEVMTMINRLLQRVVKEDGMLDGMKTWSDNPENAWYYEAVQEATNAHNHEFTTEQVPGQTFYYETWTELIANPDWATLK